MIAQVRFFCSRRTWLLLGLLFAGLMILSACQTRAGSGEEAVRQPITPEGLPGPAAFLATPAAPLPVPEAVQVYVFLGTDEFSPAVGRTDTILLLLLDLDHKQASMVSTPRDLLVYAPGRGAMRVNALFQEGGPELLAETLQYNLGIRPQHWALAHLDDFIRFVDALGGIDVPVSTALPEDCGGVPIGMFHLDGATALCYVRSRFTTSDFDRARRQQEVLQVIVRRFISLDGLARLPDAYAAYRGTVQTDLALRDLLALAPLAPDFLQEGRVHHFAIGLEHLDPWQDPQSGASVFLPRREAVRDLFEQALDALSSPQP